MGAYLNVRINTADLDDKAYVGDVLARGAEIQDQAIALEREILEIVDRKLG